MKALSRVCGLKPYQWWWQLEEENEDCDHHLDSNIVPQTTLCTFADPDCDSNCTAVVMAMALTWHDYSSSLCVLNAKCCPWQCSHQPSGLAVLCVFNYLADWIRPTPTLTRLLYLIGCYRQNRHIHSLDCCLWLLICQSGLFVLNGVE